SGKQIRLLAQSHLKVGRRLAVFTQEVVHETEVGADFRQFGPRFQDFSVLVRSAAQISTTLRLFRLRVQLLQIGVRTGGLLAQGGRRAQCGKQSQDEDSVELDAVADSSRCCHVPRFFSRLPCRLHAEHYNWTPLKITAWHSLAGAPGCSEALLEDAKLPVDFQAELNGSR